MVNWYLTKVARTYSGAKTASSINDVGKTGHVYAKEKKKERKKLDCQLTPSTGINSMWIKDLNVSRRTIKPLEENIGSKTSHSNIFADISFRARKTKEKINK